ncbi:hypothetical protein IH601_08175 [Candidatus Bipolaricaulota bacterium]|nr:hypothetical protein [Candidatus Bipolaricaulota bacterium]TFH08043.1 MAG: hypothetical protein E4H08_08470 [Candidatus Atribacteria bacterium]
MEWKACYDTELRSPGAREKIAHWLQAARQDDASTEPFGRRTVLSFPHTALDYSGFLQARVASWLYQMEFRRVIALGVVHGSLIPQARIAADPQASSQDRDRAFLEVAGGFRALATRRDTPFGAVATEIAEMPADGVVRPEPQGMLQREFSLDTFCAIVRLAADVFEAEPLPIIPVYIGMTRHPITGSFDTAALLAQWLRTQWDDATAIVTTGDVVHYGEFYGSTNEGADVGALTSRFRGRLDDLFVCAFIDRDYELAYQMSLRELKSDQRDILAVLMGLMGDAAVAEVVSFELSDYADILTAAPPCFVASALIAYKRPEDAGATTSKTTDMRIEAA